MSGTAPIALLFPGQGSQAVGMGKVLFDRAPAARRLFENADATLGFPLARVCFDGPAEELQRTLFAQLALYVHAYAVWTVWQCEHPQPPIALAGHSLGEFTAWTVSGALDFADGLRLVQRRAEAMEQACQAHPGTMAAILGLDPERVAAVCEGVNGIVQPANFNAPGQVVISGEVAAVQAAADAAAAAGGKARMLRVAGAFHSPLMADAAAAFAAEVARVPLLDPQTPVVANATAETVTTAAGVRAAMAAQLLAPVRWQASLTRMWELGARRFVEFGAGTVLAGLVKRTLAEAEVHSVGDEVLVAAGAVS